MISVLSEFLKKNNAIETNEIQEKIRKVNEQFEKEIEKEEEEIVQKLFEDETLVDTVLNDIKDMERILEEKQVTEELDISSIVNIRNVPLEIN